MFGAIATLANFCANLSEKEGGQYAKIAKEKYKTVVDTEEKIIQGAGKNDHKITVSSTVLGRKKR